MVRDHCIARWASPKDMERDTSKQLQTLLLLPKEKLRLQVNMQPYGPID